MGYGPRPDQVGRRVPEERTSTFRARRWGARSRQHRTAARRLEIFLDRVAWAAAGEDACSHAHLRNEHDDDLFVNDPAATRLRDLLRELVDLGKDDAARQCSAWERVESLPDDLGARGSSTPGW